MPIFLLRHKGRVARPDLEDAAEPKVAASDAISTVTPQTSALVQNSVHRDRRISQGRCNTGWAYSDTGNHFRDTLLLQSFLMVYSAGGASRTHEVERACPQWLKGP